MGKTVYANLRLSFPHVQLTFAKLESMVNNKEDIQDAVILWDEAHIFLDSRSSMSKRNKIISWWILMTRKSNIRLVYTTQHLHQIEKRLRDTTDIICFCRNISDKSSTVAAGIPEVWIQQEYVMQWADDTTPLRRRLYGTPVFGLYDTKQVIDMGESTLDDKKGKL